MLHIQPCLQYGRRARSISNPSFTMEARVLHIQPCLQYGGRARSIFNSAFSMGVSLPLCGDEGLAGAMGGGGGDGGDDDERRDGDAGAGD